MIQLFVKENKGDNHRLTIRDNRGEILYLIEGYWGKKDDVINLFNLNKQLLLQAKQTNFSPFFKFDLIQKRENIGSIRKHPGFFGIRDAFFTVQPNDWIIKGDFEQLDFTVFENEQKIVTYKKLSPHANYLYSMQVKRERDIILASLLVILLDHYSRMKETDDTSDKISEVGFNLGFLSYKSYPHFYFNKEKTLKKNS